MDLIAAYRTFVRLAERGSFSAVARETGQSQPTVSRRLSELENYLGIRLVARTTRALSLTPEGQELLEKARSVLHAADAAEQAVGSRAQSLGGRVRISAPASLGRIVLVPKLRDFMARHEAIEVDMLLSDDTVELAVRGVDLALSAGIPERRSDRIRKLGDVPLVLCAAPGLIRSGGPPRTVEALAKLPAIVSIEQGSIADVWRLERGAEIREVVPAARFRSDSSEALLAALVEGLGIGLVPLWLVQRAIDSQRLWRLLPQWTGGMVPLHLIWPDSRTPTARTRALADHLAKSLKGDRLFV